MNKEELLKGKFIVLDGTDSVCFGGFGNLLGNLSLLKYSEEDVKEYLIEYNNKEDDIRLANSLLRSIRELQQRIDKAIEYMKPRFMNCIDNDKRYFEDNDIQEIYEILGGKE